jgi:hypothetical protein
MGNAYNILVGKPDGKRPLGRHRHRWEDNIKSILGKEGRKLRIGTSGSVGCENGNEPSDSIKGWEFLDYLSGC